MLIVKALWFLGSFIQAWLYPEAHLEPGQTSKMGLFVKIGKGTLMQI